MRTSARVLCVGVLTILCLASVCRAQDQSKTFTYAIEVNGELSGYSDVVVSTVEKDGDRYVLIEEKTIFSATVLGLDVDQQIDAIFHVDPDTWQYTYYTIHIKSNDMEMRSEVIVDGDTALCTALTSEEARQVALPPDVILANSIYLMHVKRDFVDLGAEEQRYLVLDAENHATPLQTVIFTKVGTDILETTTATFEVVILDTVNKTSGAKTRMWLNSADGMVVKITMPNGMAVSLADPSIREQITRADVDALILSKAETDISDFSAIAYMEVKASMEPVGAWLDAEGLNVPGQGFEGTVIENRVEGVFVIEHSRYDGAEAPPFPPDFAADDSLAKFLVSGGYIGSDDPVLIEKAWAIAEGSKDSWEAAVRFSTWVADNISYEIPGGVFARKVYDMRVGECGGHTVLLAAFCRAVGIPARGVWGCMYTPMGGGSFGQHAWTEIYMGKAGWVPVDSTAHETDYVDSGHIRLGTFGSTDDGSATFIALGAKKMEVLDYRLTGGTGESTGSAAGKYVAYVGAYEVPGRDKPFRALVKNGRLGIDIPGQMVLPMNDPDENGKWTCKMSNLLYCSFPRDEAGNVVSMRFHEIVRLRRKSDPVDPIGDDVPEAMQRYLGGYFLAQLNRELAIIWDEGTLGLKDPEKDSIRHLQPSDEDGVWTTQDGTKRISFILDDDGHVISMSIDVGTEFPRVVDAVAKTD